MTNSNKKEIHEIHCPLHSGYQGGWGASIPRICTCNTRASGAGSEQGCTCGSWPDQTWTEADWLKKQEAMKTCPIHKLVKERCIAGCCVHDKKGNKIGMCGANHCDHPHCHTMSGQNKEECCEKCRFSVYNKKVYASGSGGPGGFGYQKNVSVKVVSCTCTPLGDGTKMAEFSIDCPVHGNDLKIENWNEPLEELINEIRTNGSTDSVHIHAFVRKLISQTKRDAKKEAFTESLMSSPSESRFSFIKDIQRKERERVLKIAEGMKSAHDGDRLKEIEGTNIRSWYEGASFATMQIMSVLSEDPVDMREKKPCCEKCDGNKASVPLSVCKHGFDCECHTPAKEGLDEKLIHAVMNARDLSPKESVEHIKSFISQTHTDLLREIEKGVEKKKWINVSGHALHHGYYQSAIDDVLSFIRSYMKK